MNETNDMADSVKRALTQTSKWLDEYEHWVVPTAGPSLASRLQEITSKAYEKNGAIPTRAQRDIITILSYTPVNERLGFLLSMAQRDGAALDALLSPDKFDRRLEPFRFNIYATMGGYARRLLLNEIFSDERIERVQAIMEGRD